MFYIVVGLKGDLIICFNVFTLLYKDHVNIHGALNKYSRLIELPQLGREPKERFPLGIQFLVIAASRSHYLLRAVTKEQKLGVNKKARSIKSARTGVYSTKTRKM